MRPKTLKGIYILGFLIMTLLVGGALHMSHVHAGGLISALSQSDAGTNTDHNGPPSLVPPQTPYGDAYLEFVPESGAPPNGGTVNVGDRFVLDMMLNAGSRDDVTGHESYLTFTYDLIQNVRVSQIITACVLTSTITTDRTTFEALLNNEVCNGPGTCAHHNIASPGSFTFSSSAVSNPPAGGYFRVAQVGLCAVAPGRAVLHWQFSPPAPMTRNTVIVAGLDEYVHNPALFTDYVINIAGATYTPTPTFTPGSPTVTPTVTPTSTRTPTPVRDAFLELVPQGSAPSNGGTVNLGDRFVLDLWIDTGSNNVTAHQSYLSYTYSLLQNARVDQLATACVLTNTVTRDLSIFDAGFQNEVCNGPGQCNFRGNVTNPGSIASMSGALANCPDGCSGYFRVAQIGLCAVAPGQAVLHWQFSPPAPAIRDTEIVAISGFLAHNPALFTDYVINIANQTSTPTPPGMMIGHVVWEGRPAQPNARQQVPVSVTLSSGANQSTYSGISTDASGFFTLPVGSLPGGSYTWRIKGYDPHWGGPAFLANSSTVNLPGGSAITQVEMNLMRAGDANNDNLITVVDFNIMRNMFGRSCAPCRDPRADFNGDQLISVLDFNLLKGTFGTRGAP